MQIFVSNRIEREVRGQISVEGGKFFSRRPPVNLPATGMPSKCMNCPCLVSKSCQRGIMESQGGNAGILVRESREQEQI